MADEFFDLVSSFADEKQVENIVNQLQVEDVAMAPAQSSQGSRTPVASSRGIAGMNGRPAPVVRESDNVANPDAARLQAELKQCQEERAAQARELSQLKGEQKQWMQEKKLMDTEIKRLADYSSDRALHLLRSKADTNEQAVNILKKFNSDLQEENQRLRALSSDTLATVTQQFAIASKNILDRPEVSVKEELLIMQQAIDLMRTQIAAVEVTQQNSDKYREQMLNLLAEKMFFYEAYTALNLYCGALKKLAIIQGGEASVNPLDAMGKALIEEKRARVKAVLERDRDTNELKRTIEMLKGQLGIADYKQQPPAPVVNAEEKKGAVPVIAPAGAVDNKEAYRSSISIKRASMTDPTAKLDLSRAKEYLEDLRAIVLAKEKELKGYHALSQYGRAQLEIQSQEIVQLKEKVEKLEETHSLAADLKRLSASPFSDLETLKTTAKVTRATVMRYNLKRDTLLAELDRKAASYNENDFMYPTDNPTVEQLVVYINRMREFLGKIDHEISTLRAELLQKSNKDLSERILGFLFGSDNKEVEEFNNKCEEEKRELQKQIDTLLLLIWGNTGDRRQQVLQELPPKLQNLFLDREFSEPYARFNFLLANIRLLNRRIAELELQLQNRPQRQQEEKTVVVGMLGALEDNGQIPGEFFVANDQAGVILRGINDELQLLAREEKDEKEGKRPKSGLPAMWEPDLNFNTWDTGAGRVFLRLLQRARDIRSMLLVPKDADLNALPLQLDRLGITADVLAQLFATIDRKDPAKRFNADDILNTWRANQRIPIELKESMETAIGAQLSIWRAFSRFLRGILSQFPAIANRIPELKYPDDEQDFMLRMEGTFTLGVNDAATWARLSHAERITGIQALAKMLGADEYATEFNKQFNAWIKAASTVWQYMDPSKIRPSGSLDLKIQEAVDAIEKNYAQAIDRLGTQLERLQEKHTKDITEDILTRMTNAGAEALWEVRQRAEAKEYAVPVSMIDGILLNLLRQLRPNRVIVPETLFADQQRKFQLQRENDAQKKEIDDLKTEKKQLEEKETKSRRFLTNLVRLMIKNPETDDEKEVAGVIPPPVPNVQINALDNLPINDLAMAAVGAYFTELLRRFAVTHRALVALRDKMGDLTLRQIVQKLLGARSLSENGVQDLLNSLALIQARAPAIGVGTAGFQRPLASVELDVVGDSGMTTWPLFHSRRTFGSVYGFARVVAGFLNRAEDTMMVQLVPGVESGSTVFWLIMGRIEDEIRMNEEQGDAINVQIEGARMLVRDSAADLENLAVDAPLEAKQVLERTRDEALQREADLNRKLDHRGIRTNANHFDIHAIEEKVAALLPEQRENMKKELLERRDLQMRVAIESLRRLRARSGTDKQFLQEALSFYKPQLVSAILMCYELLRRIPEISVAPLFELMTVDRVATRFAALVANSIKAIELQTDSKTFDQTLFRTLNNEQRTIVSEFQYMLKRKGAFDWDVIIQKRERWDS